MPERMGSGVLGLTLGTMSTQAANAVAITGGTATGLTQLATTAACTALLGGAAASAQSSLAILASKTIAVPAAISVWRGLDFQASTLTLTAGGVAPDRLDSVYLAAPIVTQTAGAAYTIPACSSLYLAGPPSASAAGGATPTLTAAGIATLAIGAGKILHGTDVTTSKTNAGGTITFDVNYLFGGALAIAKFTLPVGGSFGITEADVLGTADVFFQATPGASGYGYMESAAGLGMCVGTATSASVFIRPNRATKMEIAVSGAVTIASLAGTGSRAVVADANGVLSAP